MKSWLTVGLFFLGSVGVSACNGGSGGGGGTGATGTGGTGATGTGATGTTTTTMTTTTSTCPMGPQECGSPGLPSCAQGSYCESVDPCGDLTSCVPFPPACAATPTCACILAQSNDNEYQCSGSGTDIYAYNGGGATECCP